MNKTKKCKYGKQKYNQCPKKMTRKNWKWLFHFLKIH